MKKIVVLAAMLFSIVVPVQSQAADQKALVIIDSYFDSRITGTTIVCAPMIDCSTTAKSSTSVSDNANHGNAMVEVAKKQGVSNIIALRSGVTNKMSQNGKLSTPNGVSPGNFIDALIWVNNNSSTIGAVSFSRNLNPNSGDGKCSPSATDSRFGNVAATDAKIRSLISELNNKGIPIFVSTGNNKGKPVDYPACILETNSVSVGGINKNGVVVSSFQVDSNTDYLASSSVYSYKSTLFGLIPNTTSAGTVAVAAQYISGNQLNKIVTVLP